MEPQSEFVTIGDYKMLPPNKGGLIGQGAFGKVYKGIDPKTKSFVALKIIPKTKVQRSQYSEKLFEREVEVQKKVKGRNIVEYIDLFEIKGDIVLVTEFCNDGDLASKIENANISGLEGLGENIVTKYLQDFIAGYKVLLDNNIIHRDIKPGNLLIHDGVLKIADFGLAKHMDENPNLSNTLGIGSPLYMAPEVLLKIPYTNLCDIWALGVTIHEALFGECPWEAKSLFELEKVLTNLASKPYQFPGKPDSIFKGLLEGMLTFDPKERMTWDQLFSHPVNKIAIVDNMKLIDETTSQRLKKIQQSTETQKVIPPEKQSGASRIVILSQSKAPVIEDSNPQIKATLKASRIEILNQTNTPVNYSIKNTVTVVQDEHMTDEEFQKLVKQQEAVRIFRTNKRIMMNYNNIAKFILHAIHQCETIFSDNATDSDDTNFFSNFRLAELQGVFYKIAGSILQLVSDLRYKNTLNLEQWEKFLTSTEYTESDKVIQKTFNIVKEFFQYYQAQLPPEHQKKLDKSILSENLKETPEFQAYSVSYEKNFIFLCYSMIKGVGDKMKREFLVVAEYVLNVLHWKQVFLANRASVEMDKFMEIVQNYSDKALYERIKQRVEKRFQALTTK